MKMILSISALTFVLAAAPGTCFALEEIEVVSRDRAKELGLEIRSKPAGSDAVRIELEFEARGALENYSRVALECRDGKILLLSATLRDEDPAPGRVAVRFYVDRASLDMFKLKVVVPYRPPAAGRIGYMIRVNEFVD